MAAIKTGQALVIAPCIVSDLMADSPLSIPSDATALEAVKLLTEHRFGAAPVIDHVGHPVGVISRTDLVNCLSKTNDNRALEDDWFECGNLVKENAFNGEKILAKKLDGIKVQEIMTSTLISVTPDDSIEIAVELMLKNHVHRLFVVDNYGVLVGVLSTFDILRQLKRRL